MAPRISIIVCHRDKALLDLFTHNLEQTIGVPYELVVIDNSENQYSIFRAYNLGLERSQGEVLCFAHEDIAFHTQNWGELVLRHFEDTKVAMIGVAGGNCFPACPAPWWTDSTFNDHLINLLQRWSTKAPRQQYHEFLDEERTFSKAYNNPTGELSVRAAVVDGLWFCIPRRHFDRIKFDEDTYSGFHCYDTDISIQAQACGEVRVVYDILIEHFSDANANKDFLDSCIKHFEKWKSQLPLFYKTLSEKGQHQYLVNALLEFSYTMQGKGFHSNREVRRMIRMSLNEMSRDWTIRETYLLWLWSVMGYKWARYPYFIIRKIIH